LSFFVVVLNTTTQMPGCCLQLDPYHVLPRPSVCIFPSAETTQQFYFLQSVQTIPGAHPASCSVDIGNPFPVTKTDGA